MPFWIRTLGCLLSAGLSMPVSPAGGEAAAAEPQPNWRVEQDVILATGAGRLAVEEKGWIPLDLREASEYTLGHLPGARLASWLRGSARLELGTLRRELGGLGLTGHEPLLLYGNREDEASLARAFWWLERAGAQRVAVLKGDVAQWVLLGGRLEHEPAMEASALWRVSPRPKIAIEVDELTSTFGLPGIEVLDVRDRGLWRFDEARVPANWGVGHVPYSLPYDFGTWMAPSWPTDEVSREASQGFGPLRRAVLEQSSKLILYGADQQDPRPCLAYLLLRQLGATPRVLAGGFAAWSARESSPVVHIVSPETVAEQLLRAPQSRTPPPLLIDLREKPDFERLHVPTAINLPWYRLTERVDQALAEGRPGVSRRELRPIFYCYGRDCIRSREATLWAAMSGFRDIGWMRESLDRWPEQTLALTGTARPERSASGDQALGGTAISGWVVDDTGQPIAEARVSLLSESGEGPLAEALTSADGQFNLVAPSSGAYWLAAAKEGFVSTQGGLSVEVAELEIHDLQLRLEAGLTLAGRILGLDEDEALKAEVLAHGNLQAKAGLVGPSGEYEVFGLSPGSWRVKALLPGSGRQAEGFVELRRGESAELDLDLSSGFVLSGRVEHEGEPVNGALVSVFSQALGLSNYAETSSSGAFRLENLEESSYRLRVAAPDLALSFSDELWVDTDRDVVVRLESAVLAGKVRSESDGQVLSEANVRLERMRAAGGPDETAVPRFARTQADGAFRFSALQPGRYRLTASAVDHAATRLEVDIDAVQGAAPVEVSLAPSQGLSLRVTSGDGRSVDEVTTAVLGADGQMLMAGRFPLGARGDLQLSSVPPGAWVLLLRGGDSAWRTVAAEAPGDLGTVVLSPGGALMLTVPELSSATSLAVASLVRSNGEPFLRLDAAGRISGAVPLERGVARVDQVPPGPWKVEVTAADGRRWAWQAQVVAGSEIQLTSP